MSVVSDRKDGLFPLGKEIKLNCSCPDWADMCKHVAAVLYGVGARLDDNPKALFLLRGVDHEELINVSTGIIDETLEKGKQRRIENDDSLSDLFGIDFGDHAKDNPKISTQDVKKNKTIKDRNISKQDVTESITRKKPHSLPRYYSGVNLKKIRNELELTQKEMAKRLKVSASSISKFENIGRKKVRLSVDAEKSVNILWLKSKRK
jgi:uncharacterized Zn finger protein